MLGKYLEIDGGIMPNPVAGTFEYQLNADEKVYTNEAGYQMANVKRLDRLSFSATFQCTGEMKNRILELCQRADCTVKIDGVRYEGRLRLAGAVSLYEWSEYTPGTQGLWTVPVTFEGF